MSEKEKTFLPELVEIFISLSENEQARVLGVAEGMVMSHE